MPFLSVFLFFIGLKNTKNHCKDASEGKTSDGERENYFSSLLLSSRDWRISFKKTVLDFIRRKYRKLIRESHRRIRIKD